MSQLTESTFHSSKPITSFNLFCSLMTGHWRPGQFWHQRSFRRKFLLRPALIPRLTREWMTELAQWPDLDSILTRQLRLPVRLHRAYLVKKLDHRTKLDAMRYHHNAIRSFFSATEFKDYLSEDGLQLVQIGGKSSEILSVIMTSFITLDKEGESTTLVRNCAGETLVEMTFTLCNYEGNSTLFTGGLQGGSRLLPHEETQKVTRSCRGVFLKRIVMEAICCFAEQLNIGQILAVSNEQHIFRNPRHDDKNEVILSNYNTFQESVGGECNSNGYYHISRTLARESGADIASKKRAEYRRRYQLLDSIHSQLSSMFRH